MQNMRLFLFMALSFVTLLLWDAWQKDYAPKTPAPTSDATAIPNAQDIPPTAVNTTELPVGTVASPAGALPPTDGAPKIAAVEPVRSGQRIRVATDVLTLEIDTIGGDVREVTLPRYLDKTGSTEKPFILLSDKQTPYFVAQTGLLSAQGAPDHHATFTAAQTNFSLEAGADILRVPLTWTDANGITVTKTFVLRRGDYTIEVEQKVDNGSAAEWRARQYRQLQRSSHTASSESALIVTYTGGVIYSPEKKYEKIKFDTMKSSDLTRTVVGGWTAMIQHYFVGAWIPEQDETNTFYTKVPAEDRYVIGMVSPDKVVAAGQSAVFSTRLYMGPKAQQVMEKLAPGLELTVDYGWLTVIAKPIFWLMRSIHDAVQNWGWSIILLTLLIKLAFYKLSEASYRSMAHMRRVQPKMAALKERYGDDRQRMSQAMMELYRKEKINPLGGCLPIVVQIPVFIALYWVLLESVELRQAPFMAWITDLSTRDPFYVLPLLMGITMFIQQKLNPPPPDPVQAKVMMALPFVFTLFFAFFPAGLVLYWVANNTLSIAQQYVITRRIEKLHAAPAKS